MKVAVIPARGGSKRVPGKNVREFLGKPMIAWSIEAALKSELFDRVLVSTDDVEIAAVAKQFGAEIPFARPSDLADDHATSVQVLAHACEWLQQQQPKPDAVCCIYATAPFLQLSDLAAAYDLFASSNSDYVFSATEYDHSVYRAFLRDDKEKVKMFFPEHFSTRSQDLPPTYHDAAQFYWGKPKAWIEQKNIFAETSEFWAVPSWRVLDIDTEDDWLRAELSAPMIFEKLRT